jgi:hypothetical protein
MSVSAYRAILSCKVNSMPFEDRVLMLDDVPAKIGRSHKDDQVRKGNKNNNHDSTLFSWAYMHRTTFPHNLI